MVEIKTIFDVYLETGRNKTFAGAIDWPGWVRSGKTEDEALETLLAYAKRYQDALKDTNLGYLPPTSLDDFNIMEHFDGTTSTDFGVPDRAPSRDEQPVSEEDLQRFRAFFAASWQTFDKDVAAAGDQELRKGPRGGGRDLDQIVDHVNNAQIAYLHRLGIKIDTDETRNSELIRKTTLEGLNASAKGLIAKRGPRGGKRWSPRYFVRRVVWHVLDHAWEIEDRIE